MPRKTARSNTRDRGNDFRFIFVSWDAKQLTELRGFFANHEDSVEKGLMHLADEGWKISLSENQRSGRYLVSLTDKWGRKGCKNLSWGIEHSDIRSAVIGALYYATEIIGDGLEQAPSDDSNDLW